MFAALGIVLLVAGAIVLFAVDRSADGVDLIAIGWILMGGGGLSLLIAMIHDAGIEGAGSVSEHSTTFVEDRAESASDRHVVHGFVGADGRRLRRSS
jgi:Domain of unknown function (DUF6458)